MFRRRKRAEIAAALSEAHHRAVDLGELSVAELEAWQIRRRNELDELIQQRKAELAAIRERSDRLLARERFGQMLESLPEHAVEELAGLLLEED